MVENDSGSGHRAVIRAKHRYSKPDAVFLLCCQPSREQDREKNENKTKIHISKQDTAWIPELCPIIVERFITLKDRIGGCTTSERILFVTYLSLKTAYEPQVDNCISFLVECLLPFLFQKSSHRNQDKAW